MRVSLRCLAFGMTLMLLPASGYCEQADTPSVPVSTVVAARKPVTETAEFVGRVEAMERVEIKARVTGYLEAVEFTEGGLVKQGDVLYRIEKGLFQAAVEQAEGQSERSKAAKQLAELQLQRAEDLFARNTGTGVQRDQARATDQQAHGQMMVDEAARNTAKINLSYTNIVAPITGRIGRTSVTKGNVVGPEAGTLTVIVRQDPVYVSFPVSQRDILEARQHYEKVDISNIKSWLRFANGQKYDHMGTINFVDVTVERATDTVAVRATFPNPDNILIDGQLVRINLESAKSQEKILIPQAALLADQEGSYVFIADKDRAVIRRVRTGEERGTEMVIEEGLAGGEHVIFEGLQGIRPGARVRVTPAPEFGRS